MSRRPGMAGSRVGGWLGDVTASLRGTKVRANDRTVTAELVGKTFTWATLALLHVFNANWPNAPLPDPTQVTAARAGAARLAGHGIVA